MTTAERQARLRQNRQEAGLVRVEVWVPAERAEDVRRFAAQVRDEATPQEAE